MNFKPLVRKSLKHNTQKFAAYFLSSSFCVMTFFMFSTLILNEQIYKAKNFISVQFIVAMAISIFINFAIFFIGYAYSTFLKARTEEFGLYLTQGMTNRELFRMVVLENSVITAASILTGLITGTLFSKLFFLMAVKISEFEGISFRLRPLNYQVTITMFFFVYVMLTVYTFLKLRKINPLDLLREGRKPYIFRKREVIAGAAGLILIAASVTSILVIKLSPLMIVHERAVQLSLNMGAAGLYLFLYGFGSLYIASAGLFKNYYRRNVLKITQIHHRFSRNKAIIFLLCILGFAVVYYGGYGYTLNDKKDALNAQFKLDMLYIEENEKTGDIEKLRDIIEATGAEVEDEKSGRYLEMKLARVTRESEIEKVDGLTGVISQKSFTELTGLNFPIKNGQCIVFTNISKAKRMKWKTGETAVLEAGGRSFEFSGNRKPYVLILPQHKSVPDYIVVLRNEDYCKVREGAGDAGEKLVYTINFKELGSYQEVVKTVKSRSEELGNKIIIRNGTFGINEAETKFSHFIFIFISLLLSIISGSILYFSLKLEMDDVKNAYIKLYRVGITDREMKGVICSELRMVFFFPLVISCILGGCYVFVEVVRDPQRLWYMYNTSLTILLNLVFYILFYCIARDRFVKEILIDNG